jgi:hypothetical protein
MEENKRTVELTIQEFEYLVIKSKVLDLIENYVSNKEYIDREVVEIMLGGVKNA